MKKIFCLMLCLLMTVSLCSRAFAEVLQSRVVIGADLTASQIATVYSSFGLQRGQVTELKVTNAEERRYLDGLVDRSIIGTRSISSVYVQIMPPGSGISVVTNNITWCTARMYVSALSTAGVTDARIMVTAPVKVSGTAALTGIYKAYEDMTGKRLADAAKLVGTQELAVMGGLSLDIGSEESLSIVNDLKLMLDEIKNMSDEEIRATVLEIAGRYKVRLTDTQVQQLISLCRSLESLDPTQLRQRIDQVQDSLKNLSEVKTKLESFVESVKKFMESVSSFFDSIRAVLDRAS